jgi:predicted aspartyl protease
MEYSFPDDTGSRAEHKLARLGPWIMMGVALHPKQAELMDAPPEAVKGKALIDTGASMSVIDLGVVEKLGLQPINRVPLRGCSDAEPLQAPTYMVRFVFAARDLEDKTVVAAGLPLSRKQGDQIALIGRDILRAARFSYDGPAGSFTLEFR